jgi:hypothetical protein
MNKIKTISQRVGAVFIVSSLPIIGGASMLGEIPVWKAALLAGFTACSEVFIKLARASLDGKLTMDEINEAFIGVEVKKQ